MPGIAHARPCHHGPVDGNVVRCGFGGSLCCIILYVVLPVGSAEASLYATAYHAQTEITAAADWDWLCAISIKLFVSVQLRSSRVEPRAPDGATLAHAHRFALVNKAFQWLRRSRRLHVVPILLTKRPKDKLPCPYVLML